VVGLSSPILRRYVDQLARALGAGRLMFMQSNGGLVDAQLFQGKDAILSGPAGGIVGGVRVAQLAGFGRIITFDMGGTSTDVAHFAGTYERTFESEVAGVRLRAPMMAIHTVAAGGGSILTFDGARFRVGPESAGANPGPACYRRGGPLTVTDANLIVGKLHPQFFPSVFGPNGDRPLDGEIVRQKFAALAAEVARATGVARSPEELAHGCLAIAVEIWLTGSAIRSGGHDISATLRLEYGVAPSVADAQLKTCCTASAYYYTHGPGCPRSVSGVRSPGALIPALALPRIGMEEREELGGAAPARSPRRPHSRSATAALTGRDCGPMRKLRRAFRPSTGRLRVRGRRLQPVVEQVRSRDRPRL
jgi:hypothetical protein